MDEKKIFLAFIYRCLNKVYTHLYKVRADQCIDHIYVFITDQQCCTKYVLATPLANLAFHYKMCKIAHEQYNKPALSPLLSKIIENLLQNQIPTISEAMSADLIVPRIDQYNPIIKPYLQQSSL